MSDQQPINGKTKAKSTRRQFITRSAIGAAGALAYASTIQFATGQVKGANDRLGVGFIACGGRAGSHFDMVRHLRDRAKEPVELVAACDIYRPRLEKRLKEFNVPKGYRDYRELLADKNVDVVCIATPEHHHAVQSMAALEAGKHVYCEKPVTHWTQFELTRRLADAAAASKCSFQLGSQGMSDPVWGQMKKLVKDGLIGKPVFGETSLFRLGDWGERGMPIDDPNAKPGPDLDWEAFLGDRPKVAFSVDRFFRWRLFMDYAGGPSTDVYPHCLTQVVDILGVGMPEAVVGLGGIHRYDYELRDVPDTFNLLAQYPEKVTISVLGTWANDFNSTDGGRGAGSRMPIIRGWDGTLNIDRDNRTLVFTPVHTRGAKKRQTFPIEGGEDNIQHWKNLLDCARAVRKDTNSPMDLAFRTRTVLRMAMLGRQAGKTAKFDAKQRKIVL